MGHMNVQHYQSKTAEAGVWLMHRLGLSPGVMTRERRTAIPMSDYVRFQREVHAGDVLAVRGAVLELGESTVTYGLELVDTETDAICTTNHVRATHVDLESGRPIPWTAAEQQGAQALRRDWAGERAPRTPAPNAALARRSALEADRRDGLFETYRGTVQAWECDRFGHLSPLGVMGRFSHAVWHCGQAIGVGPAFYRAGNVTAGLYYDIHYGKPALAGDVLLMLSGLVEQGASRHRYLHKLYDAASGEIVAVADTMGINIDKATRRPTPWPAEVVAKSTARLIAVPA